MAEAVDINSGLTEVQIEAARQLAVGCKAVDVAEALGVDESTVSRWRRKPAFIAAVQAVHAEANAEVIGRMADLTHRALDVLEALLEYRHDPNLKLRAALGIIGASGITRMTKTAAPTAAVGTEEAAG